MEQVFDLCAHRQVGVVSRIIRPLYSDAGLIVIIFRVILLLLLVIFIFMWTDHTLAAAHFVPSRRPVVAIRVVAAAVSCREATPPPVV